MPSQTEIQPKDLFFAQLKQGTEQEKQAAIAALRGMGELNTKVLMQVARKDSGDLQREAIQELLKSDIGNENQKELLFIALESDDETVTEKIFAWLPTLEQKIPDLLETLGLKAKSADSDTIRVNATKALIAIGPKAISLLLSLRQSNTAQVRELSKTSIESMGVNAIPQLLEVLKEGKQEYRTMAASAIGRLGESAKEAIPALLTSLKEGESEDLQAACASALRKVGDNQPEVEDALIEAVRTGSRHLQSVAISALGKMGIRRAIPVFLASDLSEQDIQKAVRKAFERMGEDLSPHLRKLLDSPDGTSRLNALTLLEEEHQKEPSKIFTKEQMFHLLHDTNCAVRQKSLDLFGPEAKEDQELSYVIINLMGNSDHDTCWKAASLIEMTKSTPTNSVPILITHLKREHWKVRQVAAIALGKAGEAATSAIDMLFEALSDDDCDVCHAVIHALKAIGIPDKKHIPSLLQIDQNNEEIIKFVIPLLAPFGENSEEIFDYLETKLQHHNDEIRQLSIEAFGKIGKSSITRLMQVCQSENTNASNSAKAALRLMKDDAIPQLGALLLDEKETPEIRWSAFEVIEHMATIPHFEPKQLLTVLQSDDARLQVAAASMLGQTKHQEEASFSLLWEKFQEQDWEIRASAAFALGRMGAMAQAAYEPLVEAFLNENEHEDVRCSSLEALWDIEPIKPKSLHCLYQASKDSSWQIRLMGITLLSELAGEQPTKEIIEILERASKDPFQLIQQEAAAVLVAISLQKTTKDDRQSLVNNELLASFPNNKRSVAPKLPIK